MKKKLKNIVLPILIISIVATAVLGGMFNLKMLDALELKTLDLRFVMRGERKLANESAADAVKVIAVDSKTIEKVGRWPWPRGVIAKLVSGICGETGLEETEENEGWEDVDSGWEDVPSGNEKQENSGKTDNADTKGQVDEGWIEIESGNKTGNATGQIDSGWEEVSPEKQAGTTVASGETADNKSTEEESVEDSKPAAGTDKSGTDEEAGSEEAATIGAKNILGIDVLFDREERDYGKFLLHEGEMMDPVQQDAMAVEAIGACDSVVHVSVIKWTDESMEVGRGDIASKHKIHGDNVIHNMPLKKYRTENSSIGPANMQPSRYDERVRKFRMYYKFDNEKGYVFPFAVRTLAEYLGVSVDDIDVSPGKSVTIGPFTVPVDKDGDIYINYRGKEYSADENGLTNKENIISAMDVLENPELIPMLMQGNHIYLIGVTDPDIRDVFNTPFAVAQKAYPNNTVVGGVELHKEAIDTILQGAYLKDAPLWSGLLLIAIASCVIVGLTLFRLWAGLIGIIAAGAGHIAFTVISFNRSGDIYPVSPVLLSLPLCFAAAILYRNFVVDKEKNAVKNIFKSYVAPHMLAELMENPGDLKLGGKKSRVSILFSDIRGFTTISEKLEPDILIKGLNLYLGEMTDVVLNNSGTLDKFIGDAVMAIWGAPVPHADDSRRAVYAAVQMNVVLDRIRPEILKLWGNIEGIDIQIGVGVNTGEATLGNIGSSGKLDYTVIGDNVNLASRLEGLTKQYGAKLIISETTYSEVRDYFDCCLLDKVQVKGKKLPVGIYEVFCEKGGLPEQTKRVIEYFEGGLQLYNDRQWAKAKAQFEKALGIYVSHKPSHAYIERCEYFVKNPPPDDWDGSFEWKTK